MAKIHEGLVLHRPPPIILGAGRTALADKFCACLHAFFLETGSPEALSEYCSSVQSMTTDLGVEFSLGDTLPTKFSSIFPWASASQSQQRCCAEQEDLDDLPDEDGEAEAYVGLSFSSSLAIPGLLHIIHNAANGLLTVMPCLSSAIDKLAEVAKLVSRPASCERLCGTCFNDVVGKQHQ